MASESGRPCDRMGRQCGPVNGKTPGMLRGLSFRIGYSRQWAKKVEPVYLAATSSAAFGGGIMVSLITWIK
jgi:hypothetical protein